MKDMDEKDLNSMEKKESDLEKADWLFYFSFRLSQGSKDLQYSIFDWLRINQRELKVDFDTLRPLVMKRAEKEIFKGHHIKDLPTDALQEDEVASGIKTRHEVMAESIANNVDDEIGAWRDVLAESKNSIEEVLN